MSDTAWYRWGPAYSELPFGREPESGHSLGTPQEEPLGLYLGLDVAHDIERFLMADGANLSGGLLLGKPLQDKRPFVLVHSVIFSPNSSKEEKLDSLFSDEALNQMRAKWEESFPDSYVVGWFCSSSSRGVNLQDSHRSLHKLLFAHPWQLALIVDPVRNASQFYRWEGAKLVALTSFAVIKGQDEQTDEEDSLVLADVDSVLCNETNEKKRTPLAIRAFAVLLTALLVLMVWPAFPLSAPALWKLVADRTAELENLESSLALLNDEPEANEPKVIKDSAATTPAPASAPASTPASTPAPASASVPVISNQPEAISPKPPTSNAASAEPMASNEESDPALAPIIVIEPQDPIGYTVQPGDNLWNISTELLGTPWDYSKLAEANDIKDPGLIFPGTRISLPSGPTD